MFVQFDEYFMFDFWYALCYNKGTKGKEVNKMTDREALDQILEHLNGNVQSIVKDEATYVEIENYSYGEDIVFEFDENGNILSIYS